MPMRPHGQLARGSDRMPPGFRFLRKQRDGLGEAAMAKRTVVSGSDARGGTKEGVVRYILVASLVLVVVLFIVAYELFS
jgi:hypothetical protein